MLTAIASLIATSHAAPREALVISLTAGDAAATAVARTLDESGFETSWLVEPDRAEVQAAVDGFVAGASDDRIGVVYVDLPAVIANEVHHLLLVAEPTSPPRRKVLRKRALDTKQDLFLPLMASPGTMVVAVGSVPPERVPDWGLDEGEGSYQLLAPTRPGTIQADPAAASSRFAEAFVHAASLPATPLVDAVSYVRARVRSESDDAQIPWSFGPRSEAELVPVTPAEGDPYLVHWSGADLLASALESRSIEAIRAAAEASHPEAMYLTAVSHWDGSIPVEQVPDAVRAYVRWCRRAAEAGFVRGQAGLGWRLLQSDVASEQQEGLDWLEKAAAAGSSWARHELAQARYEGLLGIEADPTRAVEELRATARAGFGPSYRSLDRHYLRQAQSNDPLSPRSRYLAIEGMAYRLGGARVGYLPSMVDVGQSFVRGSFVERDLDQGREWLRRAAEKGSVLAPLELGRSYRDAPVPDFEQAAASLQDAAERGSTEAMIELGDLLAHNDVAGRPRSTALTWWKNGMEAGSAAGAARLARNYHRGILSAADPERAVAIARAGLEGWGSFDDHDDAFPMDVLGLAYTIIELVGSGAARPAKADEVERVVAEFGDPRRGLAKFTLASDCGVRIDVFLWDWSRGDTPVHWQTDWYARVRGCHVDPGPLEWFTAIQAEARESRVSFTELAKQRLGGERE